MHVMLLGAGGMLGRDLVATVPAAITLVPFTKAELDITDASALAAAVANVRPEVIVNAAAYTAVDRAETERDLAFAVNAHAVMEMGRIARLADTRVIHFSTDYVFDGTGERPYEEDDQTNPVNTYGASKLAREAALRESSANILILRTQWLFGLNGRSFPRTMLDRALQGLPAKVVRDQWGRPTYTVDLATATWELVQAEVTGVIHVANSGSTTWHEFARHVFSLMGKSDLVTPCTSAEYPTVARRPRYSVLSTAKADMHLGYHLPDWRSATDRFITSVQRPVG